MKKVIIAVIFCISWEIYAQVALPTFQGTHVKIEDLDKWDTSNKGNYMVLSNGDRSATSSYSTPSHTWNSVYGTEGVSSGIKTWEVTVNTWYNSSGNSWELIIGVAWSKANINGATNSSCRAWVYISEHGKKNSTSGSCGSASNYGSTYGAGDVIKVELNMNNGQLRFYKNGTDQGVAFTVDTSKTWYLTSSIGNNGSSVTITG